MRAKTLADVYLDQPLQVKERRVTVVNADDPGFVDVTPVGGSAVFYALRIATPVKVVKGDTGTMQVSEGKRTFLPDAGEALTVGVTTGIIGDPSIEVTDDVIQGILNWQTAHLAASDPHPVYLTQAEADALYVPSSRQIITGSTSGLQGGGPLSGDLSLSVKLPSSSGLSIDASGLSLGTPGTLGTASTNSVVSSGHFHAIDHTSVGTPSKIMSLDGNGYTRAVRLGMGVSPSYPLHIQVAATQARLAYDGSNYTDIETDSGGNVRMKPTGMMILQAGGEAFVPNQNYTGNLGLPNRMWSTLDVAELRARVLTIEETAVTAGGRLWTAPSNQLVADFLDNQ